MLIAVKQINQAELSAFVATASSGAALSGSLQAYFAGSGTAGPNVVYTTGTQTITGIKTFLNSLVIPYGGTLGTAASVGWVTDQVSVVSTFGENNYVHRAGTETISGIKSFYNPVFVNSPSDTGHAVNLGYIINLSGILASGDGGGAGNVGDWNSVYITGDQFIDGEKTIVDTLIIETAAAMVFAPGSSMFGSAADLIEVPEPTTSDSAVPLSYLEYVSGILAAGTGSGGGGGGSPNSVTTTGNEVIGGFKIFTGSPFVPNAIQPSGAANLFLVTGASGVLRSQIIGLSGALTGTNVILTGSTTNINITGITGNFVNLSFYFDEYSLATGLNLVETFVSRDFIFTGYAAGLITSGTAGFISGSLYQRTRTNAKIPFVNFSLNSGLFWFASGGFNQTISGLNRIGVDLYRLSNNATGLTIGGFGVGY